MPKGRYYGVIISKLDNKLGDGLHTHFVRGVKPGRVLFRPMTCKGVTCTGLDWTKLR